MSKKWPRKTESLLDYYSADGLTLNQFIDCCRAEEKLLKRKKLRVATWLYECDIEGITPEEFYAELQKTRRKS